MILNINDFEITCVRKGGDFCSLKFVLNKSQFITVPFRVSNLQKEVIDKLKLFIDHQKEIVIEDFTSEQCHLSELLCTKITAKKCYNYLS